MVSAEMSQESLRFAALGALYHGDQPEFFRACLQSLEAQTLQLAIFIVVDGAIGAELEEVISDFSDLKILYIRRPQNEGLAAALQFGLRKLSPSFDYVIRFDSDDINRKDRFERMVDLIGKHSPDLCSAQMNEIDERGRRFSQRRVPVSEFKIRQWIAFRNPINHPAAAIRIESALSVGGYLDMPYFEDWYLWERMISAGCKVMNSDEFLVDFRATEDMVRRRFGHDYRKFEKAFFQRRLDEGNTSRFRLSVALVARQLIKLLSFSSYKKLFFWLRR